MFVWTPNPNKAWAMKADGKWQLTVDPTKSDKVGGDDKYYRLGDEVAAVISGTLPTRIGPRARDRVDRRLRRQRR